MSMTFVFVHGIGIRRASLAEFQSAVATGLAGLGEGADPIAVQPCYWGEPHGTPTTSTIHSVPAYEQRGGGSIALDPEAEEAATWELLYTDSMFEFRLLACQDPYAVSGNAQGGKRLVKATEGLTIARQTLQLQARLADAGLSEVFDEAVQVVSRAGPFLAATSAVIGSITEYRRVTARAILAEAVIRSGGTMGLKPLGFLGNVDLRLELLDGLVNALGGVEAGLGKWLMRQFLPPIHRAVSRRFGGALQANYIRIGDVMRYQGRHGPAIRAALRLTIADVIGPVILLGHSLGGIASFEVMADEARRPGHSPILAKVSLLVTVGSQAAFLYEVDALTTLPRSDPLPDRFPKWLNVFDPDDFLSFQAEGLFPSRVTDREVRSRQPFPASHSAYWTNPAVWSAIRDQFPLT
jgi:hypothetical protein